MRRLKKRTRNVCCLIHRWADSMLALLCLISVEDSFSCYLSDVLAAKYCNCGNNEEVNFLMRCDDINRLTWRWYQWHYLLAWDLPTFFWWLDEINEWGYYWLTGIVNRQQAWAGCIAAKWKWEGGSPSWICHHFFSDWFLLSLSGICLWCRCDRRNWMEADGMQHEPSPLHPPKISSN